MDHRQTSIATSFNYDIPIEKQIRLIAETGFSHLSLGALPEHSGYLEAERRRELKGRMADVGLAMDTIHARPLHHPDALEQVAATISAVAELGANIVVAHVGPFNCGADGLDERLTLVLSVCNALTPGR
jgi:sugar phosphate isomerase/epimerase